MTRSTAATSETVFVIGCPRSGKTRLHTLLATHPSFAWLSQYNDRHPDTAWVGAFNRIYDWRRVRSSNRHFLARGLPHPVEAWNVWKHCAPIFGEMGSLRRADVTPQVRVRLRRFVASQMRWQGKSFFLTDYGRPCRMLFLDEIFPGSRFVHVVRDGVATAQEIFRTGWMDHVGDLREALVDVPDRYVDDWLRHGNDPKVGAALRWRIALDEVEKQKELLPDHQFLEVRYEDLVAGAHEVIAHVLNFLGLSVPSVVRAAAETAELVNTNRECWDAFGDEDRRRILDVIGDKMAAYGYLERSPQLGQGFTGRFS